MDRRGKSWHARILFMDRVLFFYFPRKWILCVFHLFSRDSYEKSQDLNNKWKLPWFRPGSGGPESSCFGPTPNMADLKCLQGIPGPRRNLKPLSGSKGLRNVGMWSIFVGSARGNPARLCLVTRGTGDRVSAPKQPCPLLTFNTVTTVCPLPCYHTHSLVRVSNGCIYRKLGKGLVLHSLEVCKELQWW